MLTMEYVVNPFLRCLYVRIQKNGSNTLTPPPSENAGKLILFLYSSDRKNLITKSTYGSYPDCFHIPYIHSYFYRKKYTSTVYCVVKCKIIVNNMRNGQTIFVWLICLTIILRTLYCLKYDGHENWQLDYITRIWNMHLNATFWSLII